MIKKYLYVFACIVFLSLPLQISAQSDTTRSATLEAEIIEDSTDEAQATISAEIEPTPFPTARPDITQNTEESIGPLEEVLDGQVLSPTVTPFNFVRHGIRSSIEAGVPANTIVLILMLPLVITLIASARHIVGIRGFGIFLPAALAIVFLATGPIIGILLFGVIVITSTIARLILRKLKIKLQYLPRMSIILWFVVLGVLFTLFMAPIIRHPDFTNLSIFPVLILVLLAEDFSKVQLGKSARTAINLASETIVMALVSYIFLTMESLHKIALLYPETLLISILVFDILIGKYVGLRIVEYWKYRKLISA